QWRTGLHADEPPAQGFDGLAVGGEEFAVVDDNQLAPWIGLIAVITQRQRQQAGPVPGREDHGNQGHVFVGQTVGGHRDQSSRAGAACAAENGQKRFLGGSSSLRISLRCCTAFSQVKESRIRDCAVGSPASRPAIADRMYVAASSSCGSHHRAFSNSAAVSRSPVQWTGISRLLMRLATEESR